MKSNLYTGTGDRGTTSLVNGERASKCCDRIEAYGTVDEFSSFLGVVASSPRCPEDIRHQLLDIQNELFNVGCYLATPVSGVEVSECASLHTGKIEQVEQWIDKLDEATPKIRAFVLPGGSELSAHTHVARTVCRRAERRILTLAAAEYVDPVLICYLNRLSDYLFILARYLNYVEGVDEITWHRDR